MGARRARGSGPDETDQTEGTQTDALPPDEKDVPLLFRGAVVPVGSPPPPAEGQQVDLIGPSGRSYHFIQDEETPVDQEDVRHFLAYPGLTFELAPPADDTPASPRQAADAAPQPRA